jgi:hypothetical protein
MHTTGTSYKGKIKERCQTLPVYMAYRSEVKQSAVSRRRRMFSPIGRSPAVSENSIGWWIIPFSFWFVLMFVEYAGLAAYAR